MKTGRSCKTKMADISHPGFCPRAMNRPKLWLSSINKKWRFYMSWHKGRRPWHFSLASRFFPSFHSKTSSLLSHVMLWHTSQHHFLHENGNLIETYVPRRESPTAAACRAREIHFAGLAELLCCKRRRLLYLRHGDKTIYVWKHKFHLLIFQLC